MILRLAILIQYWSVSDTHTHTDRQTDGHTPKAYTALSTASRGKNLVKIGQAYSELIGQICQFLQFFFTWIQK